MLKLSARDHLEPKGKSEFRIHKMREFEKIKAERIKKLQM